MNETVNVTIGGEVIALPLVLNFAALERFWPALKAMAASTDPVNRVSAGIGCIAAVLVTVRPELDVKEIKQRLRINRADGTDDRPGVLDAVDKICLASGLIRVGEIEPAETPPAPADPVANPTVEPN